MTFCVHRKLNEIGSGSDRGRYQAPEPISSEIVVLAEVDWFIDAMKDSKQHNHRENLTYAHQSKEQENLSNNYIFIYSCNVSLT